MKIGKNFSVQIRSSGESRNFFGPFSSIFSNVNDRYWIWLHRNFFHWIREETCQKPTDECCQGKSKKMDYSNLGSKFDDGMRSHITKNWINYFKKILKIFIYVNNRILYINWTTLIAGSLGYGICTGDNRNSIPVQTWHIHNGFYRIYLLLSY